MYVAPNGNDMTGDGTESNPFSSIQVAVWSISNNFIVFILPGIYTGNVDTSGKVWFPFFLILLSNNEIIINYYGCSIYKYWEQEMWELIIVGSHATLYQLQAFQIW